MGWEGITLNLLWNDYCYFIKKSLRYTSVSLCSKSLGKPNEHQRN